ncbi:hypothetical protein PHYC_01633 [Phycisphaerales bacterium]|nr:hypothetical protein PHYC_01633 [Phycisphaerales bacterium]
MNTAMDVKMISAKDFVDERRPVVECAGAVARECVRELQSGANVLLSVRGVRGVSSSFFNVILSAVSDALSGQLSSERFSVETETEAQRLVFQRSLRAFTKAA